MFMCERNSVEKPIEFSSIVNPCQYFSRIGTSVSRWCSNGCGSLNCPEEEACQCCCEQRCFAHLTQDQALAVAPGEPIPFTGQALFQGCCFMLPDSLCPMCSCGFTHASTCMGEVIRSIDSPMYGNGAPVPAPYAQMNRQPYGDDLQGGLDGEGYVMLEGGRIYRIEFTLNIPSSATVQTEIYLSANDEIVPGSQRLIQHTAGQPPLSVHVDVIFDADEREKAVRLSAIAANGLTINPAVVGETLAAMTITSIG